MGSRKDGSPARGGDPLESIEINSLVASVHARRLLGYKILRIPPVAHLPQISTIGGCRPPEKLRQFPPRLLILPS
jgi:hypothetical protein